MLQFFRASALVSGEGIDPKVSMLPALDLDELLGCKVLIQRDHDVPGLSPVNLCESFTFVIYDISLSSHIELPWRFLMF